MRAKARSKIQHWDQAQVLLALKRQAELSARVIQKDFPGLYGAALRYFGSWRSAVEAAGFDYLKITKRKPPGYWTKQRILAEIRALPNKRSSFAREKRRDLYSAAIRFFLSWELAVEISSEEKGLL